MELTVNFLPNRSPWYSPFFLNYGYHPTEQADLLCGNEITSNEIAGNFCKRMKDVWDVAYENMKKATILQGKHYNG